MRGGYQIPQSQKVTPYIKSHLIIDEDRSIQVETPYQFKRWLNEISPVPGVSSDKLQYINGHGWRLTGNNYRPDLEMTGDSNIGFVSLTTADAIVAGAFFEAIPKGTYVGSASAGNTYYRKKIPASATDMSSSLSADVAAWPMPFADVGEPFDRVAMTPFRHDPIAVPEFAVDVFVNSKMMSQHGPIFDVQFNCPVFAMDNSFFGDSCTGNAAIRVHADGFAEFALCTNPNGGSWTTVSKWKFGTGLSKDRPYRLVVIIHWDTKRPSIFFSLETPRDNGGRSFAVNKTKFRTRLSADSETTDSFTHTYRGVIHPNVRYLAGPPSVPFPEPIRIDMNRNLRSAFRLIFPIYDEVATLVDSPFTIDMIPRTGQTISMAWQTALPLYDDELIVGQLWDYFTNTALTPTGGGQNYTDFALPAGTYALYATADVHSGSGIYGYSPTLQGYTVVKGGINTVVSPGEFEIETNPPEGYAMRSGLMKVDAVFQNGEPGFDHASFQVADITQGLTRLRNRGRLTYRYEKEYTSDPSDRVIVARGDIVEPSDNRFGTGSGIYGSAASSLVLPATGMWGIFQNKKSRVREDFSDDPTNPLRSSGLKIPWRVTDVLSYLLLWADFPPEMINIPSYEIRFMPIQGDQGTLINPGDYLAKFFARVCQTYLGQRPMFMPGWGTYGQWTLLPNAVPPFTNVAHFVTSTAGGGKAGGYLPSYGSDPSDHAPVVFVDGSVNSSRIPLQFNRLIVSTTGTFGLSEFQMSQMWHNFKSFNFLGLDPSNPNYPDPEHPDYYPGILEQPIIDPMLGAGGDPEMTTRMLTRTARQLANLFGYTRQCVRFAAPFFVINDPYMDGAVRPLQFQDPVTLDGVQFLVRGLYENDGDEGDLYDKMIYELELPRGNYI